MLGETKNYKNKMALLFLYVGNHTCMSSESVSQKVHSQTVSNILPIHERREGMIPLYRKWATGKRRDEYGTVWTYFVHLPLS